MLRQVMRASNLKLLLNKLEHMVPGFLKDIYTSLLPLTCIDSKETSPTSDVTPKAMKAATSRLPQEIYQELHRTICSMDNLQWQDSYVYPLLPDQPVLNPMGTLHLSIPWKQRSISTTKHHHGNSLGYFYSHQLNKNVFGAVFKILTHTRVHPTSTITETFLAI